jgi:CDP-paratose 2-epimerase
MKKLLVTGSAGLVGSACVEVFTRKGWDVLGIDNNGRHLLFDTPKKEEFYYCDITDEGQVYQLFNKHKFDAIIHAAAQPSHDWAKKDPLKDFDINARGTLILLEATRQWSPDATFVYVSTDKVYGENMEGERLSDENLGLDFAGKRSLFGCSKAAADMYVQEYGNYFGMKTACFRPGCITGKNHEGAELHGFLAYLAKCIRTGKPYTVFGDGRAVRDQIHVYDLAAAFYHFIEKPKIAAVYNMGGGPERAVSVLEAMKLIEEETGKNCIWGVGEERAGDRRYDIHNVSRFKKDYPQWDYKYSLSDIIKDVCSKNIE